MQIMNMFTSMLNRYQFSQRELINQINSRYAPGHNRELLPPTTGQPTRAGWGIKAPDSYLPTTTEPSDLYDLKSLAEKLQPTDDLALSDQPAPDDLATVETDQPAEHTNPLPTNESDDGDELPTAQNAITIERKAELGYNLALQFDLTSFSRTIATLANGELSEIDQLTMAGFGLSTEFELSGKEVIRIDGIESTPNSTHLLGKSSLQARQASLFAAQARDFQVQSFNRQATSIRRSIDIKHQGSALKATNKIALRFTNDSRFSFSFAERFNVQTEQINNEIPESLGGYLGSASDLASSGTDEMMGAFFDAVEGYLTANREQTLDSVTALFSQAAEALGLSETEMAQMAETNLTDTIDNFFDSVSSAVADLRVQYLGEVPEAPLVPEVADVPVDPIAIDQPIGTVTEYSLPEIEGANKTDQLLSEVA